MERAWGARRACSSRPSTPSSPTATWQLQFQKAAAVWQAYANINLSQVSDDGSPEACNGNQQGDSRFGDIRIGMINLGGGALGATFLPPPFNGGTDAGDMFLNSTANWHINTDYDLETVAIHEFGHALGLGESQITTACMYAYYNGMKQSLTTDDVAGIQSVWGAPSPTSSTATGRATATTPTRPTSPPISTPTARSPSPACASPPEARRSGSPSRCPPRRPARWSSRCSRAT